MTLNPPPKVRVAIYVLVVMGTAVLVPLSVANVVSQTIMNVWTSVAAAASLLAGINVSTKD
jgi:hypothetical protein